MEIMAALEVGLGLTIGSLTNRCIPSASDLRLNGYPPIRVADLKRGDKTRISAHTDFGIISLLFQDDVGGLEIEDRAHQGRFVPVPPSSRMEMVVNVSDTLQRWTNDYLPAGRHQVGLPFEMKEDDLEEIVEERYSMAYFFKAGREVLVGPLEEFEDDQNPSKYADITALEFQKWRNSQMY